MRSDGLTVGQSCALGKTLALAGAVVLLGFSPTVRLSAQALDRTKPPTLPPPPTLRLPPAQVDTLPNGLTVAVVAMHKVPLVDVQLPDNPVAMAAIAFPAIVYGRSHPYGRPLNGTAASTSALTRDRVAAFYAANYKANGARILVVGDVTPAEARQLLTTRFQGWPRGGTVVPPESAPPAPAPRTIYLVDKPGAAQSVVRIGHVGIARSNPDYFALQVMNTILGDAFTSRLNQNLRETHGYTYGAFSQVSAGRLAGPFAASASVVTAKTDSSLIEFLKELRRIRDERVSEAELTKAKAYITLGLPGDFETTASAAARPRELLVYGLPLDYFDHYVARINAITTEDVQRVARQYLDPDHFDIVVVGDRGQIEPGIKALNEGSIVYRDLWGQEITTP